MDKLLQIQNLTIKKGSSTILNDVSLNICRGDFVILLGSNGSGKSSLTRAINGLCQYDKGKILLDGYSIDNKSISERSLDIFTLTQDINLSTFSELTVLENCRLAEQRSNEKRELKRYLRDFNPVLIEKLSLPAKFLSGGERQALALAMIFISPPKILLLDEHTCSLDPKNADNIMSLTQKHIAENNLTTIMTTHNLQDVLKYGNRIIALKKGRIIFQTDDKSNISKTKLLQLCY